MDNKLKRKINLIEPGDKIKFTYLKTPNPIKENVISFVDYLPTQFRLEDYIDYDMQFDKTYMNVITPILDSIGWRAEEEFTLESFF